MESKKKCKCPYCDISESKPLPFCAGSEAKMVFCKECGRKIPRTSKRCPGCGADLEKANEK